MKFSLLTSWKSEKVLFTSDIKKENLFLLMKDYNNTCKNLTIFEKLQKKENLDVFVKSNFDIEAQKFWQFLQFPGFGMTAKLKGKLSDENSKSKIEAIISVHFTLKLVFWTFSFIGLTSIALTLVTEMFTIENTLLTSLFFLSFALAFLIYFRLYKNSLLTTFSNVFGLTKLAT